MSSPSSLLLSPPLSSSPLHPSPPLPSTLLLLSPLPFTSFIPSFHLLSPAAEIFTAVECGVDVFDGCYPYTISEQGCALTFLHQLAMQHREEKGEGEEGEEKGLPQPYSISLKEDKYVFEAASL